MGAVRWRCPREVRRRLHWLVRWRSSPRRCELADTFARLHLSGLSFPGRPALSDPLARLTAALERRYTIERELGRGGMGTVYLALDLKHGRKVAIKILPPDVAQAVGPERFLREIEISARLTHPHILSVHDSGQAGGMLYYVMPFVGGESLRERLDRDGSLPVDQALRIAAELADALSYSHDQGVIHRDVKPENVMLAREHAFLGDFGVARALDRPGELTDSGLTVGTRRYTSPEQAAGSRQVDARSDLYSLGCVLFEMLAGSAADILERRLVEPLPPLSETHPEVPGWIDEVIARATERDPARRFASAADLRRALVLPAGPLTQRRSTKLRRRRVAAAGVVVLLAGALATAALLRSPPPALDRERVVVAGFENRSGDSTLTPLGEIATDYIARGLAATHLTRAVFDARALALEAGRTPKLGTAAGRELAERVGAGTVLSGSYYAQGGQIHFEAQLLEARSGRVLLALEPVEGSAEDKTHLVELMRQRVMAGFAVAISPDFDSWRASAIPPTYDAYQEVLAGLAANWTFHFDDALAHFQRAVTLDSGYTAPQSLTALTLFLLNDCRGVDSVAARLTPRLAALPPVDRLQVEYAVAACRQVPLGALAAAKAMLDVTPLSASAAVLGAIAAMQADRPADAIAVLQRFDPERAGSSGQQLAVYRSWLTMGYHALERYADELAVARLGLGAAPGSVNLQIAEGSALAGLGRGVEAESLATRWLANHAPDDSFKAQKAQCEALELLAHGDSARARGILVKIETWLGGAPAPGSLPADSLPPELWDRFTVHYYLGEWDAARADYLRFLAKDSASVKAHGALGAIAAHRGDGVTLRRAEAWLAARQGAQAIAARARLAALRGDRESAMTLLRQAVDQGLDRLLYLHLDPDFAGLRADPAYRELLRPRE